MPTSLQLLRSVVIGSGGGGAPPADPPTAIVSSAGTSISVANDAPNNLLLTNLSLAGGTPQGTGSWSLDVASWKSRLTAPSGLSNQLRLDDLDGLDSGDDGAHTVTILYDGEGLGAPLELELTLNVAAVSEPSGAYDFEFALPRALPSASNITVVNVPATSGDFVIPDGGSWDKVLLLVLPAGGFEGRLNGRGTNADGLQWGGIIIVGGRFRRRASDARKGPKNDGQLWRGGHTIEIIFKAGSGSAKRPYIWLSNVSWEPLDCWWGDFFRCGTKIPGSALPYNWQDFNDVYIQKLKIFRGNYAWTEPDPTNDPDGPHSDITQFNYGGFRRLMIADAELQWSGNGVFVRPGGGSKTTPGTDSQVRFRNVSFECAPKNTALLNGGYRSNFYYLESGYTLWDAARPYGIHTGNYQSWHLENVKAKAQGEGFQSDLGTYFSVADLLPRTVVGQRVYFTPKSGGGRSEATVEDDEYVEFVSSLPQMVDPTHYGDALRVTSIAQLQGIFA